MDLFTMETHSEAQWRAMVEAARRTPKPQLVALWSQVLRRLAERPPPIVGDVGRDQWVALCLAHYREVYRSVLLEAGVDNEALAEYWGRPRPAGGGPSRPWSAESSGPSYDASVRASSASSLDPDNMSSSGVSKKCDEILDEVRKLGKAKESEERAQELQKELKKAAEAAEQQIEELKRKVEEEKKNTARVVAKHDEAMDKRTKEEDELKKQKEELEKKLEAKRQELENEINAVREANVTLQSQLEESNTTIKSIEDSLQQAKLEKEVCEENLKMLKSVVASSQQNHQNTLQELDQLRQKNEALNKIIESLNAQLVEATTLNETLQSTIRELGQALETLRSEHSTQNDDQQKVIDKALAELEKLKAESTRLKDEHSAAVISLNDILSGKNHEIIGLKLDLDYVDKKTNDLVLELSKVETFFEQACTLLKKLWDDNRLKRLEIKNGQRIMQTLADQCYNLKSDLSFIAQEFKADCDALVDYMSEQDGEIEALQAQAANSVPASEVQELQLKLNAAEQLVNEMQGESQDSDDMDVKFLTTVGDKWDKQSFNYQKQNELYDLICHVMTSKELTLDYADTNDRSNILQVSYKAILLPPYHISNLLQLLKKYCDNWVDKERTHDLYVTRYYPGKWYERKEQNGSYWTGSSRWNIPNLDWLYRVQSVNSTDLIFLNNNFLQKSIPGNLKVFFDQRATELNKDDPALNNKQQRLNLTFDLDFKNLKHAISTFRFIPLNILLLSFVPKITPRRRALSDQRFFPFNFASPTMEYNGVVYFDAVKGGVYKMFKSVYYKIKTSFKEDATLEWYVRQPAPDLFDPDDFFKGFNLR